MATLVLLERLDSEPSLGWLYPDAVGLWSPSCMIFVLYCLGLIHAESCFSGNIFPPPLPLLLVLKLFLLFRFYSYAFFSFLSTNSLACWPLLVPVLVLCCNSLLLFTFTAVGIAFAYLHAACIFDACLCQKHSKPCQLDRFWLSQQPRYGVTSTLLL